MLTRGRLAPVVILLVIGGLINWTGSCSAQEEGFILIVHENNPTDMISTTALSEIFLKKKVLWNDGTPTDPVDQAADSPVRERFSQVVHNRSTSQIKSYWQQKIFSGADTPPVEVRSDQEVIDFVRVREGGIGYVSSEADLVGVRVMAIVEPPVPISKVPPAYTARAQRFRIEGDVKLRVLVGTDGRVKDVEVIEGLKHGLTDSAIEAAQKWRFQPATSAGQTVDAWINITIEFRL